MDSATKYSVRTVFGTVPYYHVLHLQQLPIPPSVLFHQEAVLDTSSNVGVLMEIFFPVKG